MKSRRCHPLKRQVTSQIPAILPILVILILAGCSGSGNGYYDPNGGTSGPVIPEPTDTENYYPGVVWADYFVPGDSTGKFAGKSVPGSASKGLASSPEITGIAGGQEVERQCLALVNYERSQVGLPPLQWDDDLADAARSHSVDMYQRNYFGHGSQAYTDANYSDDRVRHLGLGSAYINIAENCGKGQYTAARVVQGWMNSPGHRQNILASYWVFEGIGVGISPDGKIYITQDFS